MTGFAGGPNASGPRGPFTDEDLHAYADGQLPPERHAEVERWLNGDAEAAARVAFYARLNQGLHRRFDQVLAEPIPAEWKPAPIWRRRLRDRRRPSLRQFGVAAAWLFAGLFGGWSSHDLLIPPRVVEHVVEAPAPITTQAAVAFAVFSPEVRHPVEVGANEDHLLRWLSTRMGRPIKAPTLDDSGWHLMGGRLLPVVEDVPSGGHVACQFMYENASGERVTLYMKSVDGSAGPSSFRYADEVDGISVYYWLDTKLAYALAGKVPKDDLKRLAWKIYVQFNS
jgi:anti-sigma factor RsiW